MKKVSSVLLTYMVTVSLGWSTIIVTTAKIDQATPPTVSGSDLGQTAASSISGTVNANPISNLFDGSIGTVNDDTGVAGATEIRAGNSVTIDFDVTTNTLGYDITGIDTYAGWKLAAGGRSDQGYGITLTFMDDSTAALLNSTHWEPNATPREYWTTVSFVNNGGGALSSDFVDTGSGPVAGNGILASGVKSITFDGFFDSNAGSWSAYREIDIFGAATVPEPSSAALLGLGLGALFALRRRAGR